MLCSDHVINDMYVPSIKIAKQCQKSECFRASFVKYVPHEGLVHSVIETKMIIHFRFEKFILIRCNNIRIFKSQTTRLKLFNNSFKYLVFAKN